MQVVMIQSIEGQDRTEGQRKNEFALCLSWDTHLLPSRYISIPGSRYLRVLLGLNTVGSPGSHSSGLGLEPYHQLPRASSLQTAGCETSQPP